MSTKKPDNSSIVLFRTDDLKKIKFGGLIPESILRTKLQTAVAFPTKPVYCVAPLPETFYFNDVLQN